MKDSERERLFENGLYHGDYKDFLVENGPFDYIFTVPPDYSELSLDPKNKTEKATYREFLFYCVKMMTECAPVITVGITDRKCSGTILSKHSAIIAFFQIGMKWRFMSHKIWVKTDKINLYRPTFTHIMTFSRKKVIPNKGGLYAHDVFWEKEIRYEGFPFGMNVSVIKPFIEALTKEGDKVCDPFTGSGSTAIAALTCKRKFVGSEIDEVTIRLAEKRILQYRNKPIGLF